MIRNMGGGDGGVGCYKGGRCDKEDFSFFNAWWGYLRCR